MLGLARPLRLMLGDDALTVITGPLKAVISKRRFDLSEQVWLDRDGDGRFEADEAMLTSPAERGRPSSWWRR